MNTSFKSFFLAGLCLGSLAPFFTACSHAPIQRSSREYDYDVLTDDAVTAQLVGGLGIKRESITVETFRGAVTLSGFVNSEEQRERATQFAMGTRGVQSVKNELTVLGSTAPAPKPEPVALP